MSESSEARGLASLSLEELRAARRALESQMRRYWARLEAIEARKTEIEAKGAVSYGLYSQQVLARQVADLDGEAEQQARLVSRLQKQQKLLDRLILAREDTALWKALRQAAPTAMSLDWPDLVRAAADATTVAGADVELNRLLRTLGVPEEEWPKEQQPQTPSQPGPERAPDEPVLVMEALDGRTLRLATREIVRYIGVLTPPLHNALGQPEPGAVEVWEANRRLVEGRFVRLEADKLDKDLDGALWRYVWVDKTCANAELIRQGLAYHAHVSPNTHHSVWFSRLEDQARSKKRGFWK